MLLGSGMVQAKDDTEDDTEDETEDDTEDDADAEPEPVNDNGTLYGIN